MAQKPPPSNVVPFRKLESSGGGGGFRLPAWVPRELVGTATGWIVLANLAVWIAMIVVSYGAGIMTRFPTSVTFAFGSLEPTLSATEPWRMLSSTFIHADIGHIAMNMAILWFTGRQLERAYGSGRLVVLYFSAALMGSVFSIAWHLLASPGSSVGASGGVLGVVAGLAMFFWRATGRNSDLTKQWLWFCGLGLIGGMITSAFGMAVDNAAHLGGMTGGALVSWLFAGRPAFAPRITRVLLGAATTLVVASIALSLTLGQQIETAPLADPGPDASREGMEALARRDYALAEQRLAAALDQSPGDPWILTQHATALFELELEEKAKAELQAADDVFSEMRALQPQNAVVALGHAKVLLLLERREDGIDALRAGIKGRAPDGDTFGHIAVAFEELGLLDEARLAAAKGRIADPRSTKLREIHERINAKIAQKAANGG